MAFYQHNFALLLGIAPFDLHSRSGWSFGTKRISDAVVARLIASGIARRDGDRIVRCEPAQICATRRARS